MIKKIKELLIQFSNYRKEGLNIYQDFIKSPNSEHMLYDYIVHCIQEKDGLNLKKAIKKYQKKFKKNNLFDTNIIFIDEEDSYSRKSLFFCFEPDRFDKKIIKILMDYGLDLNSLVCADMHSEIHDNIFKYLLKNKNIKNMDELNQFIENIRWLEENGLSLSFIFSAENVSKTSVLSNPLSSYYFNFFRNDQIKQSYFDLFKSFDNLFNITNNIYLNSKKAYCAFFNLKDDDEDFSQTIFDKDFFNLCFLFADACDEDRLIKWCQDNKISKFYTKSNIQSYLRLNDISLDLFSHRLKNINTDFYLYLFDSGFDFDQLVDYDSFSFIFILKEARKNDKDLLEKINKRVILKNLDLI